MKLPVAQLVSVNPPKVLLSHCYVADSFWSRLKGLIGYEKLTDQEGLLIDRCNNIHMWFMSMNLDIVFLKKQPAQTLLVSSIYLNMKPWRPLPLFDGSAQCVLEVSQGWVQSRNLQVGETLCLKS